MNDKTDKAEISREKILFAAIDEFAESGYNKASTNKIMDKAGMAKGLLFHYYSSKQKLFCACLEYILYEFQKELDNFISDMPDDLFKRLEGLLELKSNMAEKHPVNLRLLLGITELPDDLKEKTNDILFSWRMKNRCLIIGYDKTLWNPSINQKDAVELIVLLFNALDQKWINQINAGETPDNSQTLKDSLRMLNVLKKGFYI